MLTILLFSFSHSLSTDITPPSIWFQTITPLLEKGDEEAILISAPTGQKIARFIASPDAAFIACLMGDGSLQVFTHIITPSTPSIFECQSVSQFCFTSDSAYVIYSHVTSTNTYNFSTKDKKSIDCYSPVTSLVEYKNKIACGLENGLIKIWNIDDQTSIDFIGHAAKVTYLSFSKSGARLASSSNDGSYLCLEHQ